MNDLYDKADASGEKRGEAVQAGGVLEERWRWRVLSAKVLPHFTRTTLMAPQQASQLQVQILLSMDIVWSAAKSLQLWPKL